MKKRVLLFARSFLAKYYADIESSILEPIYVTLTHEEQVFLEGRGRKVSGCFEDEYDSLVVADFPGNYLKTSFNSDRFLCRFSHEKRMEILGKEITFWRRIIEETKPDFLVNETVAVEIAEVMAIEAGRRKIPFYTSLLGFLPNTFYWKPNPFTGSLDDLSSVVPSDKDVYLAQEYINNVKEKNYRPFYVSAIKKYSFSLKTVLHSYLLYLKARKKQKRIESGILFKYEDYSIFSEKSYEISRSARGFKYDSLEEIEGRSLLFYPMHLEPEATLNYFVAENYDQATFIRMLVPCMKNNQYLVVKEHPQQQGALSLPKFQDIKKSCPNVVFLPSYISSFEVLKRTDAVVTLTSTVGWEALILGITVFVIGGIFYDQCPGATKIKSLRELKIELRKDEYIKPKASDVVLFAAKMVKSFHPGCPSPGHEDTIQDYISAIEQIVLQKQ